MTEPIHPSTDDCWRACYESGEVHTVAAYLDDGVDINLRAPCSGAAPLDASIWGGHMGLVRYLVERGADVDGVGYSGFTALMAAANQGMVEAVHLLLERGADPNLAAAGTGETPLHCVTSHGYQAGAGACLNALLDAGADPDPRTVPGTPAATFIGGSVTFVGETPLHLAAAYGSASMIRRLLDAGADPQATDARGETPFHWFGRHRRDVPHHVVDRGEGIADRLRPA